MKAKIILCLLFLGALSSYGQQKKKINTSNYYDYFLDYNGMKAKKLQGTGITTNWLRIKEVIPFIIDELKKAGYEEVYDNELVEMNDKQSIIISVYSRKSNFGFLYIEGHLADPTKEDRIERTQKKSSGFEYVFWKETSTGESIPIEIKKLPENIFVLNENCYWYQYTDIPSDQKFLVSKEDAFKILKEDIKVYLLKVSNLKK